MSNRVRIVSLMLITSLAALAPSTGAIAGRLTPRGELARTGHFDAIGRRNFQARPVSVAGAGWDRALSSDGRESSLGDWGQPFGFGSALVGSAPTGIGPAALAVDPATHTIYVATGANFTGPSPGGDTVSVIDSRHCNARDVSRCKGPWPTIKVGKFPAGVAIDEQTDTVYVETNGQEINNNSAGDGTVAVFNGATCNAEDTSGCGQTPASIPVGVTPTGIYVDDANDTVYVANLYGADLNFSTPSGDTVSMIDSATCTGSDLSACPTNEPPAVKVGVGPGDVDVNEATHTVYVAVTAGVSVFDADTCNATSQTGCADVGTLSNGDQNGVYAAAVDPANDTVYTANGDNTISAFDVLDCDAGDLAGCASAKPGTVTPFPDPGFQETDVWVAVDQPLHSVYVAYTKDAALVVVNTNLCNATHLSGCARLTPPTIHTGADPLSVVLDSSTQTLYTPNQIDNDISVIDATQCDAENTTGCRHPAPSVSLPGPGPLATDSAVHTAYVTSGSNAVSMIDSSTCNAYRLAGCAQMPPQFTVGQYPDGVAVNPATHTVYVTNNGAGATGTVSVINDRTCNAEGQAGCQDEQTLQVPGGNPDGILVNPANDTVYVTTIVPSGPNLISVFNGATCNATDTSGCSQTPAALPVGYSDGGGADLSIALNQKTNTLYATNVNYDNQTADTVYVINAATCNAANTSDCNQAPATITVGDDPRALAVDPATDTIYVVNHGEGDYAATVSVINGATCDSQTTTGCNQTPVTVATGFGASEAAIDTSTHRIYTPNVEDTSVSVINGTTCNAINTSGCDQTPPQNAVGNYPYSIALDPATGTAYVSNMTNVSVIPLAPWSRAGRWRSRGRTG